MGIRCLEHRFRIVDVAAEFSLNAILANASRRVFFLHPAQHDPSLTTTSCPYFRHSCLYDYNSTAMKRPTPTTKKLGVKMTATGTRINSSKTKKVMGTSKTTIPKTASSGIKHQVILPKRSTVIASSSSTSAVRTSSPRHLQSNRNFTVNQGAGPQPHSSTATTTMKTSSRRVSKRNGVWYLGGNHVVKLLTSVDGDLDHSVLAKLAAVPTVVGELALSVESLVSDDITVGGFESDLLAKITSNTLTAKRGIMAAAAASAAGATPTSQAGSTGVAQNMNSVQPTVTNESNAAPPAQVGEGQVPNPLLANYQPVPNPLAIRITPPASPHANATQVPASNVKTKAEMPMIQAR